MVDRQVAQILTSRLVLKPVTREVAGEVVSGRLSTIAAGAGWPHADTADAMAMALNPGAGPGWLVNLEGIVIGDCGCFSWPDEHGAVEIGYGLAEPFRGNRYGTEAAKAMCRWLFDHGGATVITATEVEAGNVASRRVLDKLGFTQVDLDHVHVSYRLERKPDE